MSVNNEQETIERGSAVNQASSQEIFQQLAAVNRRHAYEKYASIKAHRDVVLSMLAQDEPPKVEEKQAVFSRSTEDASRVNLSIEELPHDSREAINIIYNANLGNRQNINPEEDEQLRQDAAYGFYLQRAQSMTPTELRNATDFDAFRQARLQEMDPSIPQEKREQMIIAAYLYELDKKVAEETRRQQDNQSRQPGEQTARQELQQDQEELEDNVNWQGSVISNPVTFESQINTIVNDPRFLNYLDSHEAQRKRLENLQDAEIEARKGQDAEVIAQAHVEYLRAQASAAIEYINEQENTLSPMVIQARNEIQRKVSEDKKKLEQTGNEAASALVNLMAEIPNSGIENDLAFKVILGRLERSNKQIGILKKKSPRTPEEQRLLNELQQSMQIRAIELFFNNPKNVEKYREKKLYSLWLNMRDVNAEAVAKAQEASRTFLEKRQKKKGLLKLIGESEDYKGDPALWFAGWLRGDEAAVKIWKDRAKWPMGMKIAIGLALFGPGILAFSGPLLLIYMKTQNARQERIDALRAINDAVTGKVQAGARKQKEEEQAAEQEQEELIPAIVTPAPTTNDEEAGSQMQARTDGTARETESITSHGAQDIHVGESGQGANIEGPGADVETES